MHPNDPTIDPLLSALPPSWLAALETYAPHAIAWALLVLALVHVLLPLARRIEAWAIATPDPRDDGPARRFVQVLETIAGVSRFVLSWIPRFTIGDPDARKTSKRRRAETMRPPPSDGGAIALALIIVAAACSVLTSGCSTRALGVQVDLVASGAILWTEADTVLVQLRASDLDSVLEAARDECAGGCDEERAAYYRAELEAAEERWAPAMECRATVPAALRSWLDGIETARAADSGDVGLQLLSRLGGRFALDYVAFVACVNARAPVDDPHLPPLPAGLEGLASSLASATAARTSGGEDVTR